ncbi:MAG TPA: sugar ABC transporter permease, partial [Candidatus Acetothermia bacterium]|nr:sugar ABC transporter permease [Candidatus Acetothermia bacterium]
MRRFGRWRRKYSYFLFLLPALILIVFLTVYPLVRVFYLSFYRYNPIRRVERFAGFANYLRLFSDRFFLTGLKNTFLFSVGATVTEVLLGLGLALIFNVKFRGRKLLLPLVIFPMMFSTMVICAIWRSMYH